MSLIHSTFYTFLSFWILPLLQVSQKIFASKAGARLYGYVPGLALKCKTDPKKPLRELLGAVTFGQLAILLSSISPSF